jgi:hypothetical protein
LVVVVVEDMLQVGVMDHIQVEVVAVVVIHRVLQVEQLDKEIMVVMDLVLEVVQRFGIMVEEAAVALVVLVDPLLHLVMLEMVVLD